jgi:hypothetical protein
MDEQTTAIEAFFHQLIRCREICEVVISNRRGQTVINFDVRSANASAFHTGSVDEAQPPQLGAQDPDARESNAGISGSRAFATLEQLAVAVPVHIAVQYHDNILVQFIDGPCLVSLIGRRSEDQCIGGLISVIPQVRAAHAFRELVAAMAKMPQYS